MKKPKLVAPPGACDTHFHIYEPEYPKWPTAPLAPIPGATYEDYLKVAENLGIERFVVVQPTSYGRDNQCTLEAMDRLGGPRVAKGVVVVDMNTTDAEMEALTAQGCVAIRFHFFPGGVLPWDNFEALARKVHDYGWHVQLQMNCRELPEKLELIKKVPGNLVIDHCGKFIDIVSPDHPGFKALQHLVDEGNTWVKLSAAYEFSKSCPPKFEDVGALTKRLIQQAPDRMLWASNWPHPGNQNPRPDDETLLDTLLDWADDSKTIQKILCDNPVEVYGFNQV
jgi:D-galactarolactone isomerase